MAKVTKTPAGTAIQKWDEKLAALAAKAKAAEASAMTNKFISIKGARLKLNGNEIPGGKMNVVIVDSVIENHFYTEKYDADNPSNPVCFAFGEETENGMAPHADSTEPQHETCKGCPQNEWGTADVGRGKACKNIRRLSLITEDALEDIDNAEIAYLKVPTTSVKGYAGYVTQLDNTMQLPPLGVVTEISVHPHDKWQVEVKFKFVDKVAEEHIGALFGLNESGKEQLMLPYKPFEEAAEPAPKTPAKPAKYRR